MYGDLPTQLLDRLEQTITGQRDQLELALATLLSGGHLLLEDRPGVGKTLLARSLGIVLGIPTGRIQGTPDLLPTDITGVHIFQPNTSEWNFRPGPIFTSLLLVDELNRATPKAQSALLEAMAEGQVTIDGETLALPRPFMVIATQNPLGEIGTHSLAQAQIDRFAAMLHFGLPGRVAERAILGGESGAERLAGLAPLMTIDELHEVFKTVAAVDACPSIIDYVLGVVDTIRAMDESIWLSVRVSQTLLAVARGQAFMRGRDYVAPEDVQSAALPVLAHRLPRGIERSAVEEMVHRVPVPTDAES